jgi:cytochrome c553
MVGFVLRAGLLFVAGSAPAAELPSYAYPVNAPAAPGAQPARDDGRLLGVPGSEVKMTRTQISARGTVPDWHPGDRPPMPDIVAKGREPGVRACGFCHTPSGAGRPENAALSGLTPAYIKQQVLNFRNGLRQGSEPRRVPQNLMIAIAKAASDAEIEEAAKYFASIKPVSFVKVVESATAPKLTVVGGMTAIHPEGGTEPNGNRLVEVPEDLDQAEKRDPRTTYVAYAPPGSLAKGAALVNAGGNGKTVSCGICHGDDLRGLGDVPHLAGRSPSYLIRQLYDIQQGTRSNADLMKQVVAKLDSADMVAIAAYVASRAP